MINEVDIQALSQKEIEAIFLFYKKGFSNLGSYDDIDKFTEMFLSSFRNPENELFIIMRQSSIFGIITFYKALDWNKKEQYQLNILLSDLCMDRKLIGLIDSLIEDKLYQQSNISILSYNNQLKKLFEKYNYKVKARTNYYTLKKEDIDIKTINKWIKEAEIQNSDLRIEYTNLITEKYLQQYCDLFTETMKDMTDAREEAYEEYVITPELQRGINEVFKKSNRTHNCYMIFNSSNEMIGKSNVAVSNADPRFPYQFMIGVKKEYRNRGLGKWLYASMYKRLYENVNFEQVIVCHHEENIPAIRLSKAFGYKFRYLQTDYILKNDGRI